MESLKKVLMKHQLLSLIKILILLIIVLIVAYLFYYIFFAGSCDDQNCFISGLKTCRHVSWIKEDSESAWLMIVIGNSQRDSCKVNFKILNIKKGTVDSEKLIGKEMVCNTLKTETTFPPTDISQCTGLLKEGIQDILIKRMHDYLLRNIGELKQEFKSLSA